MDQPKHDYLVISRGQWDEHASHEDVQRAIDQFYVWYESHLASGRMKPGSRLASAGKVITHQLITDGPFAETKEIVGGYWFIVAASLDEAAALAAQNPCLAVGLTLELRPLDAERPRSTDITNETPLQWRQG
ncbi:YciI family protein [Roseateles sp. BYS78W]|uniref:YciI family protein n=1 Tax=Pelomonas candidula TaxID=3299025 RepID=A0ABW7H823_9BURK